MTFHVQPIDDILDNWARWHWSAMRRKRGRCASLEGNYRSRQYWDAPPVTPKGKPDEASARHVEEVWRTLPYMEKLLLKWHYVFTRTPGAICRSMRQRGMSLLPQTYEREVGRAKDMLMAALEKKRIPAYNALNAVVCATTPRWEGVASTEEREAA